MLPLPEDFLKQAKKFAGADYEKFISSLEKPSGISIRLNPYKPTDQFDGEDPVSWSLRGKYLKERPSFTLDPLFHAGCYYVQDASSQFLEIPFQTAAKMLNRSLLVLDLCAAPGGKSTHLLSMLGENDLLVSNEVIPSRNNILRQNIIKWGCANVVVTQNDPSQLAKMERLFDIIVVDAPCSGEGLFRKDKEAISEWSLENVERCAVRQNEILDHAFEMLKPDGCLIYSTCTFEPVENDDQIKRLIEQYNMSVIPVDYSSDEITKTAYGFSFYPHRTRGEGFYISLLQKRTDETAAGIKTGKSKEESHSYLSFLKNSESFTALKKDENLYAILSAHFNTVNYLRNNSYVRLAGIHIGELKGKDVVPSEALALSNDLGEKFPVLEFSKEDALDFLRGGNPSVDCPNGFAVVSYKNHTLGWIKKIGNRVNNYYPKEWRIRNK